MAQPSSMTRRYILPLTAFTLAGVTTYLTLTPKKSNRMASPALQGEKLRSDTTLGADEQKGDYAVKTHRSGTSRFIAQLSRKRKILRSNELA